MVATLSTTSIPPGQHTNPAIEVCNLVKRYPKAATSAVNDVSFTVQRGEIFGLLGPNGAGKTSTIGILTTSILPTSGICRIMDIDVKHDPMSVKQRISVVPQRNNLDQHLTVREILTFHASYHGVPRAKRNALAHQLLDEFGLNQRGREKVNRYSGGMVQRVMIARALMHTPEVLFLDEPTNNLDPQTRLFLWERIRALQERGITILLTTHDMEEASRLCDRIAIMDHGRVLVCDTPGELKKLIPGGGTLELRVQIPVPNTVLAPVSQTEKQNGLPLNASNLSHFQRALEMLPGVTKVEEIRPTGEAERQTTLSVLRLYAQDTSVLPSRVIQVTQEWNAELHDLHLARPSLEDVFIFLTGRNLRA